MVEKVKKMGEVITYATSIESGIQVDSPPKCWRRPGRKPCKGILEVGLNRFENQIHWICPVCGDEGVISGWEGLIWDMMDSPDTIN